MYVPSQNGVFVPSLMHESLNVADANADSSSGLDQSVVELARAFRGAARAVAYYPAAHPAVAATLQPLVVAINDATACWGPLCFTVLPTTVLVDGATLQSSDRAVADLAGRFHRHGIGAMRLNGRATLEAWQCFLTLIAQPADEVRASGGVQKQWGESGHASPAILEIDFGDLLRGRVGGDVNELSGVISHYLESGAAPSSIPDAALQALLSAIEAPAAPSATGAGPGTAGAPLDASGQVEAILRVLRSVAQLSRLTQFDRLEEAFQRAAEIGGRLSVEVMAGLVARRGSPQAHVGPVDVVTRFIDSLSDDTIARFLARAVAAGEADSRQLGETFATLVPGSDRRKSVLLAAQAMAAESITIEEDFQEKWIELGRALEAHSDRRYVPDEYARELETARTQAVESQSPPEDSPDVVAAWLASIDDDPVRELDLQLQLELIELETDPFQWRELLGTLILSVGEAVEAEDWQAAASMAEAIAREAGDSGYPLRQPFAAEALEKLAKGSEGRLALSRLSFAAAGPTIEQLTRLLRALGPSLVPAITDAWRVGTDPSRRIRLEGILAHYGVRGAEALRPLFEEEEWETRRAAAVLVERLGVTTQLSALGSLLADPQREVRRAALNALASSASEQGAEILARHIARSSGAAQAALLGELKGLDRGKAETVLRHFIGQLDQRTANKVVYLSIIETLARSATDEAVDTLMLVLRRRRWTAPFRGRQFGAAAVTALGTIHSASALEALREISETRALGFRACASRQLARLALLEPTSEPR